MKIKHTLRLLSLIAAAAFWAPSATAADNRWTIQDDDSISWEIRRRDAHEDHVEMSGLFCSTIITYGVDSNAVFSAKRHVVFPMLRFQPNITRDHLALDFTEDAMPRIFLNNAIVRNPPTTRIWQKGILRAEGTMGRNREVSWTRSIFPSPDKPVVIDKTVLVNRGSTNITIWIEENERTVRTNPERGIYGGYIAECRVAGAGKKVVEPGGSLTFAIVISARKVDEPALSVDVDAEEKAREARVNQFLSKLQLHTPDRTLNTAFAFAKIRGTESIYKTKGGLMHGPGGGNYYAAIWANDQAEYANPFFPFLGDDIGNESAMNAFRHFARFMNPGYRAIPSSITSEGATTWHGARDRGDMAMIAYGATRFALAYGRKDAAEELWPLIEWSLEYCRRKIDSRGVVASDSDELENRFPAGNANLCTSSLYYDALISAAHLARELGKSDKVSTEYTAQAATLRKAIESHFGARVEGFDTYRYYDKNDLINHRVERHRPYAHRDDVLRAWICIPLTVGIYDRADATIEALFSPRLWTDDGLATEAGQITFWDRSTLYALRGVFAAGGTQRALDFLTYYSNRRLLGDHVPYPVEAYPENNQRHLSAESTLYCRIYTEGLFGIRPTGFKSFTCTPRLPKDWNRMALRKIQAFNGDFDLAVTREAGKIKVDVLQQGKPAQSHVINDGDTVTVSL